MMQSLKVGQATVEERMNIAHEQSALFPTRLALARWMSGSDLPQLHRAHPPVRAAWLAKAQRDYQAWLDRGGFVQHDEDEVADKSSDGESAVTSVA
jgi:hypothetical protein